MARIDAPKRAGALRAVSHCVLRPATAMREERARSENDATWRNHLLAPSSLVALASTAAAMSRLLAAALVAAAAGGAVAAPSGSSTFVLSSSAALGGAAGADGAPGGVSYESLSQQELAAGLLRASGAAPAQKAGWEATHWPAGEAAPQLLAVLVGSVDAARQVRPRLRLRARATPHRRCTA